MCLVFAGALLFSMPAITNNAIGEEPVTAKNDSLEGIVAACQEAKSRFRPLTAEDLKSVKAELVEALSRLDARLKSDGPNGEDWRKFLLCETLQKELQQEGIPNRDRLNQVYQRYASGNEGLGFIWFLDAQSALRRMLMVMGAIDNPQTKTLYEQNLDKLANHLKTFAVKPTTEDALDISESVRWLTNARQAPELVEAVQRRFNQPNLYAEVSAEFVAAALGEPVDDTTAIYDYILGTDISGTGHTIGQTTAELTPDANHGVVDTLLFATTYSTTVGSHGPVCIYSNGTTHIGACKRLWVNEFGIFSYPAVSNAVTQTCINDIQARRQIIERIAWKKVGKQKSSAENVASQHAQQRVNERIDAQASKTLDKAQQDFTNKFRQPLCDHKLFPDQLQFSTDKQSLQVVSMQIGNSRLAAPAPPPNAAKADMILRVHESMINNFTLDALGGMTVHEEKLQAAVIDMIGRLPDKLKGDEDQEPWAITFARRQPISVTFSDDGFKITIRGSEYFKGDAAYPAMDVTAIYKIEKTANGFKAVRQGEIQIFPPGRQQVGGKEQIIRQLLTKRFGKVFEPEISDDGFLFTGKLEKVGKMQPVEVQSRDGWLTIAWKRAPADQKIE
jgi:flagellar motor protein MotB